MKGIFKIFFFILAYASSSLAQTGYLRTTPLFQLSGGFVYSSIDLSRYNNSVSYRGFHGRVVTHLGSLFYLSTEYSAFPVHESPSAWNNIHTRKFDINGHISFATNNNLTRIFVLAGANRHQWKATRTAFTDLDQLAKGLPEGTIVNLKRWGLNFGCGFTQLLYENIGVFGDFRFCFGNTKSFEKIRIMDVMTTLGLSFNIPHFAKSKGKKTYGIGKKIYKWTNKGAD